MAFFREKNQFIFRENKLSKVVFFFSKNEHKLEKPRNSKCGDWGKVNFCCLKLCKLVIPCIPFQHPVKTLQVIKKPLVTFLGVTVHFSGENGALRWSILVGKKSIMYKGLK